MPEFDAERRKRGISAIHRHDRMPPSDSALQSRKPRPRGHEGHAQVHPYTHDPRLTRKGGSTDAPNAPYAPPRTAKPNRSAHNGVGTASSGIPDPLTRAIFRTAHGRPNKGLVPILVLSPGLGRRGVPLGGETGPRRSYPSVTVLPAITNADIERLRELAQVAEARFDTAVFPNPGAFDGLELMRLDQ
ncbi:MAG: hypothetical protein QOI20_3229, partial [Acidimicrobiaceae bacterium]|nr:hypothetical protein [Acidimicrobiaceae bacterium]